MRTDILLLPTSVNDRVILVGFYFHKTSHVKFRENRTFAKSFEFTVYHELNPLTLTTTVTAKS